MSEPVVREPCRAKLNLFLDVVGRRPDGFHDIVTVFHEIDLADEIEASRIPDAYCGVTFEVVADGVDASQVPRDSRNLAARAAKALLRHADSEAAVHLKLTKRIPTGAGLGGGSADAAGALRAIDKLLDLRTSEADLEKLAAAVGSDVPFLLRGGTAVGRGRGEILERVSVGTPPRFVLLFPGFGVPTADVYAALPDPLPAPRNINMVLAALSVGDVETLAHVCSNALTEPAMIVEPRLRQAMDAARAAYGPAVHMSGSGSTLFVPTASPQAIEVAGIERVLVVESSPRASESAFG